MHSWVASDQASIMVRSSRLHLDPSCSTTLDTLYANDCSNGVSPPTASPLGHINGGEIGGIAVGAVIVLLLIVLIVVIMLKKWRPKIIRRYTPLYVHAKTTVTHIMFCNERNKVYPEENAVHSCMGYPQTQNIVITVKGLCHSDPCQEGPHV